MVFEILNISLANIHTSLDAKLRKEREMKMVLHYRLFWDAVIVNFDPWTQLVYIHPINSSCWHQQIQPLSSLGMFVSSIHHHLLLDVLSNFSAAKIVQGLNNVYFKGKYPRMRAKTANKLENICKYFWIGREVIPSCLSCS